MKAGFDVLNLIRNYSFVRLVYDGIEKNDN